MIQPIEKFRNAILAAQKALAANAAAAAAYAAYAAPEGTSDRETIGKLLEILDDQELLAALNSAPIREAKAVQEWIAAQGKEGAA